MKRLIPLLLLALTGCAHNLASCANAPQARAAATLALQALDRVCPMN
jgi:hypothetical protein